ncbi:FecR family protein [Mariniflexile litorale]|uniref:FecR family protein n=1 Tax=Mariniflexile litorale TaxID=3045158 RepID=A0AAU7EI01_9FLAO|nr:FecR family protein [Mariniflexile sp. KMM 9835]MDQ8209970.1 FecR family protein [Mariniflexile sp. KMM 9835]
MRNKNKKLLLKLIKKLIDGSITKQQRNILFSFFVNNQSISSWPEEFSNKMDVEKRIFNKVKLEINVKSIKTIPFYRKKIFKKGIAASFLILVTVTYLVNHKIQSNKFNGHPIIVNNNIKIGIDKATLTLEDGTVVDLEKGQHYNSDHLESNGAELIYKAYHAKKAEVLYNYLTIPRGGQYHVVLSDGTQIWLNSESQIKYPVSFVDGETRSMELIYGEAYFDVSPSSKHKGADFKVSNNNHEVRVLGTEFNIKAYNDDNTIRTTLVEGKVEINYNGINKILIPNQQSNINLENKKITVSSIDVYKEISWKEGVFSFENMALKDIMKVLSRWYDIEVVFENKDIENITFNGGLKKKQSIVDILSIIKSMNNINYEINNKTVIFK